MKAILPADPPAYYPSIAKAMIRFANAGLLTNVTEIDLETDYGYLARLTYTDGSHRIILGTSLGVNSASAAELARDKGFTKFMLRKIGVRCPNGAEFILPWWYRKIGIPQEQDGNTHVRTTALASQYVEETLGYPVYVKPIDGSLGEGIYKVQNRTELEAVLSEYDRERVRIAAIEEPIPLPDYRIVCVDGKLICAYQRLPLSVTGDGVRTIAQLIDDLQHAYRSQGRKTNLTTSDERIRQHLHHQGLDENTVPATGERIVLTAVSNLSAGGTSEDVTDVINQRWVDLAVMIAQNFSLRVIGLDLACADITASDADYSVLEVNSSPGLEHYASSGEKQRQIVDKLYLDMLNTSPASTDQ